MSWYYARGGQQRGPVDFQKLVAAAKAGKLRQDDLVWTEGMAEWKPVAEVPEFGLSGAVSAAPVVAAVDPHEDEAPAEVATPAVAPLNQVSYYAGRANLPERALRNLRGYASPLGDVGEWPLSDAEIAQLAEACKQRKPARSAQALYRLLCAVVMIFCFFIVVAGIETVTQARGRGVMIAYAGVGIALLIFGAISAFYGIAASATRKNQPWGAITATVLFVLSTLTMVGVGIAKISTGDPDIGPALFAVLGSVLIGGVMIVVSVRAIGAMRRFRACPAWCQELTAVVNA